MASIGYIIASSSANWDHTPAGKFFWLDGKWYVVAVDGTQHCLFRFDGPLPSVGTAGGWTKVLNNIFTAGNTSVCVDWANNRAWLIGYSSGAATVQMRRLDYNTGTQAWSVGLSFNVVNSAGVGLGTSSTFKNNPGKLSIKVDDNGVPFIVAGNKGLGAQATDGVHIAWPDSAAAINSTWSFTTIDADLVTEGDASGMIAGVFTDYLGVRRLCVCYSADAGTDMTKFAHHTQETTLANYATGWTKVVQDATHPVDNHLWGGIYQPPGQLPVIVTIGKDDVSRIFAFLSKQNGDGSWTHKVHRVTNGSTDTPGPTQAEASSRGVGIIDETNGILHVLYHESQDNPEGAISYKSASIAALLAASSETSVFDTSARMLGTQIIKDEVGGRNRNSHGPDHPVTSAMTAFPVGAEAVGVAQWYNFIDVPAARHVASYIHHFRQQGFS